MKRLTHILERVIQVYHKKYGWHKKQILFFGRGKSHTGNANVQQIIYCVSVATGSFTLLKHQELQTPFTWHLFHGSKVVML